MERLKLTKENHAEVIAKAVETLKSGGILIYPTETCYGIGVDATNQEAVDKVLQYKARREGRPISVAVTGQEMASKYVEINDIAENLYKNYLPGPITIVSRSLGKVANGVESEFGTLGIRVPDYQLILDIVEKLDRPMTSTSANVSYKPNPYSIDQLLEELPNKQKEMIGLIIDAGQLEKRPSSTVVDTTLNNLNVMREGTIEFNKDISNDDIILKAETKTAEETQDFGSLVMLKHVTQLDDHAVVLALKGELGAGKTQFVKGLGRSLKIKEMISSPTFTIVDEYEYSLDGHKGMLYHMDTWRVDGEEEFERTGIDQYLQPGNILAIEWADKFYAQLAEVIKNKPVILLKVDFEYLSETERSIKVYKS